MAATILIIDDEEHMRWIIEKALTKENYRIVGAASGTEGLATFTNLSPDLVLLDLKLPDLDGVDVLRSMKQEQPQIPVIMITAHGTVETAIEAMKIGAADYISKPFDMEELKLIIRRSLEVVELASEIDFLRGELGKQLKTTLIGHSLGIIKVKEMISKVADTLATVLIQGESGTGKEVVAQLIHQQSCRAARPFVAINCAAIPENLLESELFGYERGAFTGATMRKKGKLELVNGGTVFLDEIGEMSPMLQVKLLRVLQEKSFERVGGNEQLILTGRIIAASNRDLQKAVQEGKFREDLYYRLKVIPIDLPPLRDRKADIPELVQFFLGKHDYRHNIQGISPEALDLLKIYRWPGNIRELENAIERAVILCAEEILTPQYLPHEMLGEHGTVQNALIDFPEDGLSLEDIEKDLIIKALAKSGGNQSQAARLLKITRSALIYRMEKYRLH
ncbi:MAG: sigma-54 dependent transcriptional regulator [Carboxydocellales bacterium]